MYIEVPESDYSCNGDEDEAQFVSPFPLSLDTRAIGIRKLSCVDASSYQSEESIPNGKKKMAPNKTYSLKSGSLTNNTSLDEHSDFSCVIVDAPESNDEHGRVNEPGTFREESPIYDVNMNESRDLRSGNADGTPMSEASNDASGDAKSIDEPQKSGRRIDEESRSQIVDEPEQIGKYDDNGALNLSMRRKIDHVPNADVKTSNISNRSAISCGLNLSLKADDRKISAASLNRSTSSVVAKYSPNVPKLANNYNVAAENSLARNVPTKRKDIDVFPTQTIARNDVQVFSDDEMDLEEQSYSPKRVKAPFLNRTVQANSQNGGLQPNEQRSYFLENQSHANFSERNKINDHVRSIRKPENEKCDPRPSHSRQNVQPTQIIRRIKTLPSPSSLLENQSLSNLSKSSKISDHYRSIENEECDPHPSHSRQTVHPTQTIRRIKPLLLPNEIDSIIQIEDGDENTVVPAVDRNKSAGSSIALDRSTPILVSAVIHTTPDEMDRIYEEKETINWRSLDNSRSNRAQSSQPFDFDAIESYDPRVKTAGRVKQTPINIALPESARKNCKLSFDKSEPFVSSKLPKSSSHQQENSRNLVDSIYDMPTQVISKNNTPKFQKTVRAEVDDIISLLDDDAEPEPAVPIKSPKPGKKASTARNRAKAAPKTKRNTKKTPANHVNFVFEAPNTKRRQSRKKVVENLRSVSPCSEIASMATVGIGASKKRKLFNRDAAVDELELIDDGSEILSVKPTQSKTTEFDELLETTISSGADLDDKRRNNPKKFFNRVTENMNKISSQTRRTPLTPTKTTPSPAIDPFDALKDDSMDLKNSMGKVTYSYRTSKKTKSQIKNNRTSSTKTSTCKTSVICIRNE